MRFTALLALAIVPTLLLAAPVPKAGSPRLIAASSHKDGLWGIYLVHPDTGESKRLTDPKKAFYGPTWAPDGKRIAFVSSGVLSEIWTMNADGTDVRQLTKTEGGCGDYRWSPDGTRIAFILGKGGKDRMNIVDVATGKLTQLTDGSVPLGTLAWSPDGKRLLYSRRAPCAVHTVNPDGTDDRKVTDTNGEREAAWSPDGTRIAYAACPSDWPPGWRVFTVGADGKGKKQLTTDANTYKNTFPQWSPDGNRIAFTGMVDEILQVGVVSAIGGEVKIITSGPLAHSFPKWSPDGKSLCYLSTEKGKRGKLVVSDSDGGNAKVLLADSGDSFEWKPK